MRDRYELYVLARELGQVIERKRSKDQATDGYEVRVLTSYKGRKMVRTKYKSGYTPVNDVHLC